MGGSVNLEDILLKYHPFFSPTFQHHITEWCSKINKQDPSCKMLPITCRYNNKYTSCTPRDN